jgi:hypothetical protein
MSTTVEPGQPTAGSVQKVTRKQRKQEAVARQSRYTRQTIRKFDLWSVLKVSLCFNFCGMLTTLVAFIVLWMLADAIGAVRKVEDFLGQLVSSKNFTLVTTQLLFGGLLVGLVLVALFTILTVLAAAFYNLFSEVVGGVEVVVAADEQSSN